MRNRVAPKSDDGMTVTELMIVVLLMGIVSVVLFTSLYSMSQGTEAAQTRAMALAQARQAVEVLARDLRAANPIDAVAPVSGYDNQVSFDVYCANAGVGDCSSVNLRKVQYRYDAATFSLRRKLGTAAETIVLGPAGPKSLPLNRQRGAVVNPASSPVFAFFGADGAQFATSGGSAPTKERFRDCTKAVQIRIAVISDLKNFDRDIDLSTKVNLRNHNKVSC